VTLPYAVGEDARADIRHLLAWSEAKFGPAVRDGYEELLFAALSDIAADPHRLGVKERPDLGPGVRTWHLALSRDHVADNARRIATPRHIIVFRVVADIVQVARVLHEAMDLPRHRLP
jgi:toxin ParE1/3/4